MTDSSSHLVVIVGFDARDQTVRTVRHLQSFSKPPDVMVIENGLAEYPEDTQSIRLGANYGYTGAANCGIHYAFENGYSSVTIMNPDVTITERSFDALGAAMLTISEDTVVICGVEKAASGAVTTAGGSAWSRWTGAEKWNRSIPSDKQVLFAQGAFVTFTRGVLAIPGPFNEEFFMFFDEVELGLRLNQLRLCVRLCPEVEFERDDVGGRYRELRGYLMWRNRALLVRANSGRAAPFAHAAGLFQIGGGVLMRLPQPRLAYARASFRGWRDGRRGITDLKRAPDLKYLD
jgi:GT2 family glycosyltransferase